MADAMVALFAVAALLAEAALLAVVAAVMDSLVVARILLAHDRQAHRAAAGLVDGTTGRSAASAEDEAGSSVVVAIPLINPGLRVGSSALEGEGGGIEEVVNVNVG